jgi:hypothetical protein
MVTIVHYFNATSWGHSPLLDAYVPCLSSSELTMLSASFSLLDTREQTQEEAYPHWRHFCDTFRICNYLLPRELHTIFLGLFLPSNFQL